MPTNANHPTTLHASLFYSPLPQLLRHGKVVFLIPDQPVPLHEGQLVAQRAALHVPLVRQLLAVVWYVEFVAAGALDALREIGQQPLADGLGRGVQHPAGELQILPGG